MANIKEHLKKHWWKYLIGAGVLTGGALLAKSFVDKVKDEYEAKKKILEEKEKMLLEKFEKVKTGEKEIIDKTLELDKKEKMLKEREGKILKKEEELTKMENEISEKGKELEKLKKEQEELLKEMQKKNIQIQAQKEIKSTKVESSKRQPFISIKGEIDQLADNTQHKFNSKLKHNNLEEFNELVGKALNEIFERYQKDRKNWSYYLNAVGVLHENIKNTIDKNKKIMTGLAKINENIDNFHIGIKKSIIDFIDKAQQIAKNEKEDKDVREFASILSSHNGLAKAYKNKELDIPFNYFYETMKIFEKIDKQHNNGAIKYTKEFANLLLAYSIIDKLKSKIIENTPLNDEEKLKKVFKMFDNYQYLLINSGGHHGNIMHLYNEAKDRKIHEKYKNHPIFSKILE